MKNVNMNPDARLSFLERFAYGIGDYAGNLVYSAISAFLLVYYTNVIGQVQRQQHLSLQFPNSWMEFLTLQWVTS